MTIKVQRTHFVGKYNLRNTRHNESSSSKVCQAFVQQYVVDVTAVCSKWALTGGNTNREYSESMRVSTIGYPRMAMATITGFRFKCALFPLPLCRSSIAMVASMNPSPSGPASPNQIFLFSEKLNPMKTTRPRPINANVNSAFCMSALNKYRLNIDVPEARPSTPSIRLTALIR